MKAFNVSVSENEFKGVRIEDCSEINIAAGTKFRFHMELFKTSRDEFNVPEINFGNSLH